MRLLVLTTFGVVAVTGCSSSNVRDKPFKEADCPTTTSAAPSPPRSASVLDSLRILLRQRSPAIDEVALWDVRKIKYRPNYAAVGWGVRGDHTFRGSWEDELFMVMMLDSSLTRIVRVFEVIPSPRWLDFDLGIERITGDSLVIAGKGATYGDIPIRRAYSLSDSI